MESAGGLVPQLIAAGVGGGIVALIGLIGVLIRIFVRLGRLEKAVEGLEAGLKTTQDDVKELRRESQEEFNKVRREFREDLQRTEDRLRQEFREDLQRTEDRLRQEFREELRNTEERLRDLIRAESEATRETTRNEIRRLTDALVSHSHELDGSIRFSMPPQYPGQGSDGAGE